MDKFDKQDLKIREIIGNRTIKQIDKKGKAVTSFNIEYLKELLKQTKGKRIGKILYILKDNKTKHLCCAVLMPRKKMRLLAPKDVDEESMDEAYKKYNL